MAKTKKTTKTSRRATAAKTKAGSPKKKAAVKKSIAKKSTKKKSVKKTPVKKTPVKKTVTTSQRGKAANKSAAGPSMDRRSGPDSDQRQSADRRVEEKPVHVERRQLQRREKVNRRRQIDPTTCERDYTVEEVEFMRALDEYKRKSGRMFPTCSEILEVIRDIGYSKQPATAPQPVAQDFAPPAPPVEPSDESLATLA